MADTETCHTVWRDAGKLNISMSSQPFKQSCVYNEHQDNKYLKTNKTYESTATEMLWVKCQHKHANTVTMTITYWCLADVYHLSLACKHDNIC